MKTLWITCVFVISCFLTYGQAGVDTVLQKKILAMFKEDQKWRVELNNIQQGKHSVYDEKTIERNEIITDSLNQVEAIKIINTYGFPGYKLVGKISNNFWAIIQHCDDNLPLQQKALTLMEVEVKNKNADGEDYAMLQDRVLVAQGKKQLYGTQLRRDPETKQVKPLPIQDSINVDIRRKAVGMMPLNEYLKFANH